MMYFTLVYFSCVCNREMSETRNGFCRLVISKNFELGTSRGRLMNNLLDYKV